MSRTLAGRRVLVTGGGTGLGADLAVGFAGAGADVVIAGRTASTLAATAAAAASASGDVSVRSVVADVTDEASVAAMFVAAGPIDIVIANAGAAHSAPLHRTELDRWQHLLDVNLTGVFLTLREGWRQLRGHGWGRLITIASTAGVRGYPYVSAYTAAKHGAVGLTRAIACEVAGTGVTANALCPGYLDTEMTQRTIDNIVTTTGRTHAEALAALIGDAPGARLVAPGEVTAAALALCTPGSEPINGEAIVIDAGQP